ncbi:MAG TPA: HEPN domain-containing protein [Candidatus Bathyarchaeia archaeon]|nr:HEPN domain-containing protein [Candidatus Bathyarchaeia archaeon]
MTRDTTAQLEKAKESLAAANLLRAQGYNDFTASRAYYAMFYVAEALLASLGQSYSSHAAIQAAYGREFAKVERLAPKFHRWMIDAQDLRNIGDYGLGAAVSPEQAAQVCEWASEFIAAAVVWLRQAE